MSMPSPNVSMEVTLPLEVEAVQAVGSVRDIEQFSAAVVGHLTLVGIGIHSQIEITTSGVPVRAWVTSSVVILYRLQP